MLETVRDETTVVENARNESQKVHPCPEAYRLLDAFGDAVRELMAIHELQFRAVVEKDDDAGRFDILIHEANEVKQNAKYAYLEHLNAHRCGKSDET